MKHENKNVLVGILKSRHDLDTLKKEKWYRIPVRYAPKKKFSYVAFYEPKVKGLSGKRIRYYAKVGKIEIHKRIELLPNETQHPRKSDDYLKIHIKGLKKLPRPIMNHAPRRVVFGFTTWERL